VWEFENKSGGWFHPIHIHLIDFKILNRNGKPPFAWELGAKDVVYVGEGEKVRLIMKFGSTKTDSPFSVQTGRYMIHCHNLVHEDNDMMSQFSVGLKQQDMDTSVGTVETFSAGYVDPFTPPIASDKNHPIKADPPVRESSAP
jgi:Multicopper oxidase